ncbi:MAG: hypothetical protein JOY82_22545 [Streptosporangiaceae bacterium]|nr:hypothetical protein [Streptosporangiaceae bacterium]
MADKGLHDRATNRAPRPDGVVPAENRERETSLGEPGSLAGVASEAYPVADPAQRPRNSS